MNYEFKIEEWLPRFPLSSALRRGRYSAEIVTSPYDLCVNEELRSCVRDQFDWGPAEPVDVFVMARGEPPDRFVTKIGGLPYRRAGLAWPNGPDGTGAVFLGQFCFSDSHDIVGDLPGEVLLIFGILPPEGYLYIEEVRFEWYPLGLDDLIRHDDVPEQSWRFEPCFGHRYRTVNYPAAKRINTGQRHADCNGHEVRSDYLLLQYQATQIGRAPRYIQSFAGDPDLPGQPLCTISSIQPAANTPYPFVNDSTSIPLDEFPYDKWLMLGDMGCLYISIDRHGTLHGHEECY